MNLRHLTSAFTALAVAGTAIAATTAPAQTAEKAPGTQSLATALAASSKGFDSNPNDFDILYKAITATLKRNPSSGISVVTDGTKPLTAFAPTDNAFRLLLEDLTGRNIKSERRLYRALNKASKPDQVELVILYHVVLGKTLTYNKLKTMNGKRLTSALGKQGKITVKVGKGRVTLVDRDKDDVNPKINLATRNLNKGNRQIAHGIDHVLRPINLEDLL